MIKDGLFLLALLGLCTALPNKRKRSSSSSSTSSQSDKSSIKGHNYSKKLIYTFLIEDPRLPYLASFMQFLFSWQSTRLALKKLIPESSTSLMSPNQRMIKELGSFLQRMNDSPKQTLTLDSLAQVLVDSRGVKLLENPPASFSDFYRTLAESIVQGWRETGNKNSKAEATFLGYWGLKDTVEVKLKRPLHYITPLNPIVLSVADETFTEALNSYFDSTLPQAAVRSDPNALRYPFVEIEMLPRVIVIEVRRQSADFNVPLDFSEIIYCPKAVNANTRSKYRLQSVIVQKGVGASSTYTAAVKRRMHWLVFDNDTVSDRQPLPAIIGSMAEQRGEIESFMLFYCNKRNTVVKSKWRGWVQTASGVAASPTQVSSSPSMVSMRSSRSSSEREEMTQSGSEYSSTLTNVINTKRNRKSTKPRKIVPFVVKSEPIEK